MKNIFCTLCLFFAVLSFSQSDNTANQKDPLFEAISDPNTNPTSKAFSIAKD